MAACALKGLNNAWEQPIMMRAKTELKVKRWKDQRWLLDTVIQAVGMEWDQPRLNYTMYPAGPDAIGDFRAVGMRVRKFADMHREFAAAARRREVKAQGFEKQGRKVSARESYFIAALLYSAARWQRRALTSGAAAACRGEKSQHFHISGSATSQTGV
jgi:hypothetical protein